MCCRNRRSHPSLFATGLTLAAQKYEEKKAQKNLRQQATRAQPLQDSTVEQVVPAENPPPYQDDEKMLHPTRYAKYVNDDGTTRSMRRDSDSSFYYENGQFYYSNKNLKDPEENQLVGKSLQEVRRSGEAIAQRLTSIAELSKAEESRKGAFGRWKERRRAARAECWGKRFHCC